MPSLAEDSDDFTAALDAVEDMDSESNDEQDSESESDAGSDLGTLRSILNVPQPDAPMHEVRKALEVAQCAYTAVRSELRVLEKDYTALQAAIPPHSRNRVLKKTSTVDSSISRAGKMYAMFNYFWVMNGLFPTTPQPNVDPRSNTCWSSPDAKLKGAMAELYLCFGPLFRAAVSSERSNILHVIKDCAGSIFSNLKLDPTTFTDEPSKKKENMQLLTLIKKNGEGEYTHLAPILFKDPSAIIPDDFLMSPILVKIIRVKMFGKAVLSGKTKGHPKARGQRWATQCVTEGMIAGAAILARFLLSHDHELTAIGPATKIEYQQDFDFYLEWLFKRSSWAISVMDYYNREVFGTSLEPSASATVPSISHSHSWEDDFLQQLDSETPAHPPPPAPTPALSLPVATPISSQLTYVSAPVTRSHTDVVSNYHFTATTISQGGVASASAIIDTQLQVDIGQLSLKDSAEPSASKSCRAPAATTHKCHTGATQKAQSAVDSDMSPIVPLAPPPAVKRVTCNSGNRVKKAVGKTK
ncbi:uncharacterized protein F5891DRAFT_1188161 [Suillus fuscotomentosus]|uniref:Uncharacterized protein n=1 Tax=Suillus fuscotomentosus TaxID=1912939 RepID=A0AAD4E9R4_9AGAM|nr:uncharacterized protein F5891DRAFT_1188161 [Suillus fuscotomentosus]KAG1901039.1 hypothetical protein F5891DRAFT_1188161 [Suillus fuscotomentosus]